MDRIINFSDEHKMFREAFGKFLDNEVVPNYEQWEKDHIMPREMWKKFGDYGYLCSWADEKYGGVEADFLYAVIEVEELQGRGLNAVFTRTHNQVIAPYINAHATDEQKMRWLPGCVSGDKVLAVAMTEPGAGSDLGAMKTRAIKQGDYYILNGSKTFISNGINADLVVVAAKTDPAAKPGYKGISLFVVERGTPGFERGKAIEKIGLHAQDTAELFFENCKISKDNLLGAENKGFYYLMEHLQQERIVVAVGAVAQAERCLQLTLQYVKEREIFGTTLSKFQNTQFELAKAATEIQMARCFVDQLILEHIDGKNVVKEVSMAKYYTSELAFRTADRCLQLFGGYGFCAEYPISKMFVDTRVTRLYAGTSEIMLNVIAKELGL